MTRSPRAGGNWSDKGLERQETLLGGRRDTAAIGD